MRRIFLFIILIVFSEFVISQNDKNINLAFYDLKPCHFGFSIGLNEFSYHIDQNPVVTDTIRAINEPGKIGLNFGVVANFRLTNNIDLRLVPEILFYNQAIAFNVLNNGTLTKEIYKAESTQLNIPLLFKLKYKRLNNYRLYFITGCKYQFNLETKQTQMPTTQVIQINSNDFSFEVGVGLDIYLTYFKLSPEFDFSLGLMDLNKKNNLLYSRAIDRLTSKVFILHLYFE